MGKRSKKYETKPLVADPYEKETPEVIGPGNIASAGKETTQPDTQPGKRPREIITVDVTENTGKKTPTAAYVRLSSENSGHADEGTLQTQIDLVQDYISQQPDLELYDLFCDNGVSGVGTFENRPEFERMMEAVRRGRVQCIVVKDLSRFGRNHLEAGTYIDRIFPLLGVRLIAVTDNFDSARPSDVNSLTLPLKNLVNEMYARDIGKKIRASIDTRDKEGKLLGNKSPYGYLLVKEGDDRKLVPDPETKGYLRVIFHWYLLGVGLTEITRRLDLAGIPTPDQRKAQLEYTKRDGISDSWSTTGLTHILENQRYTGDTVNRKWYDGTSKLKSREEWHVNPDTHEALISHEDFDKTWERLREAGRHAQKRYDVINEHRKYDPAAFSGILVCGACGKNFQLKNKGYRNWERIKYYRCGNDDCVNARISLHEDVVKILVMRQIRTMVKAACDYRKLAKKIMSEEASKGKAGSIKVKLTNARAELKRLRERELDAYEDYAEDAIDRETYLRLKEKLDAQKKKAESIVWALEAQEHELKEVTGKYLKMTEDFEGYLDAEGYSQEIVDALVERIEYFPDGSIKLTLKCADVYEEMQEFLDAEKEERTPTLSQVGLQASMNPAN